jgi:hypothetical protein
MGEGQERAFTFPASLGIPAPGLADGFRKIETYDTCSFSPGEKVRMRASDAS